MSRRSAYYWIVAVAFPAIPLRAELTSADSAAFDMNTPSTYTVPSVTDSAAFNINTALTSTVPSYIDSPAFNLNTTSSFTPPAFADSATTTLNICNINRAWGDSEPFSMNVPHATPTLNSAVPQCDGITPGIRLTWTAAPGATNYDIYRNNALIFTTQTNGTTFWNVTNLSAGATYIYKIRARFGVVTSPLSNPVSAVAPTCASQPPPQSQPPPGNPGPTTPVTIDRLWVWSALDGTFKPPTGPVIPNPVLPTYIIAHGWDGALDGVGVSNPPCQPTAYAMSSIACAILQQSPANIYAWNWAEAANPNRKCDADVIGQAGINVLTDFLRNYISQPINVFQFLLAARRAAAGGFHLGLAIGNAYQDAKLAGEMASGEGAALTAALRRVIQANNGAIGTKLHFIGHSHGGGLLGETARLLRSTYVVDSVTALDTPSFFSINTQELIDPAAQDATAFAYYPYIVGGFGGGPLPNGGINLALDPAHLGLCGGLPIGHTWVHGCDAPCTPPATSGWYPGAVISAITFDGQSHSILDVASLPTGYLNENGILGQTYEFTSVNWGACCTPQGCRITTLADCNLLNGEFMNVGSNCTSCAATRTSRGSMDDPNLAGMSVLFSEAFEDASSWQAENAQLVIGADPVDPNNSSIVLNEQAEASLFRDIALPPKCVHVTFDYMFRDTQGEESLTVYLNDQVIHYDNSASTLSSEILNPTRAIYIGQYAGTTARLTFVLRTDNIPGGSVVLDNIRIWGFIPGDLNGDGKLDGLDVQPFISAVLSGSTDAGDVYIADFSGDLVIGESDIAPFVDAMLQ